MKLNLSPVLIAVTLTNLVACNSVDIVGVSSPSPTADPQPTITPPTCPVGPAPIWSLQSATGNWDYTIGPTVDANDGDLDVYSRIWNCTNDPLDPNPPHKLEIDLDLDNPSWSCPAGVAAPCPVYSICCT